MWTTLTDSVTATIHVQCQLRYMAQNDWVHWLGVKFCVLLVHITCRTAFVDVGCIRGETTLLKRGQNYVLSITVRYINLIGHCNTDDKAYICHIV